MRRRDRFDSRPGHRPRKEKNKPGAVRAQVRRFLRASSGNILISAAILFPVLVLIVGVGIDYALVTKQKSRLQLAVDAAALATAREMSLSDANTARLTAAAKATVKHNLGDQADSSSGGGADVSVNVDRREMIVRVNASQTVEPVFGAFMGDVSDIAVMAEAKVIGQARVCAVALEGRQAGAIDLDRGARMTGKGCAIFSNSKSANGLRSLNGSVVFASMICTSGGRVGGKANYMPEPLTDCPQLPDPLAQRPEPEVGPCVAKNLRIFNRRVTLSPGTYCGGLTIEGSSRITLRPGIYVMKNGPLKVDDTAELSGQYVGFFYTGKKAVLYFAPDSVIDIEAPRDGPMAGILMFESRNDRRKRKHSIFSNNARNLLGTIYFPNGIFRVDAQAPIADQSAYTVIIARKIELYRNLDLVLNTNYGDTDIPVPEGVDGLAENVILTR